jgi:hypothetical protein
MNTKEFDTYEELESFVNPLVAEKKWCIDVRQNTNTGKYSANWIEHKFYDADGQQVPDEIWTTRVGEMICVQDMSEKHVRDVLRMILRAEREQRLMLDALAKQIASGLDEAEGVTPTLHTPSTTLH